MPTAARLTQPGVWWPWAAWTLYRSGAGIGRRHRRASQRPEHGRPQLISVEWTQRLIIDLCFTGGVTPSALIRTEPAHLSRF